MADLANKISMLTLISYVLIIIGIALAVLTVILIFKLHIPNEIKLKRRSEALKKAAVRVKSRNQKRPKKAAIPPATSHDSMFDDGESPTEFYPEQDDGSAPTTFLSDSAPTEMLSDDTTVMSRKHEEFYIKKDIILKGSEKNDEED